MAYFSALKRTKTGRRHGLLPKPNWTTYIRSDTERFDAYPGRGITQDRIDRLATCEWIDYGKDLIIVGATGTGKSFLAQALAVAACRQKLTARYFRLNDLANEFDAAAEHPQARKQLLAELQAPALVVIDDFLATDVSAHVLNQVFNLLVGRENASTVIASQHEPVYWYDVFSEAALADAVMSRLANHGSKLTLTGQDRRTRDDIKKKGTPLQHLHANVNP